MAGLKSGKKEISRFFIIKKIPNQLSFSRFAIVTSKKCIKKAVDRNKIRRRIYESIRLNLKTTKSPQELSKTAEDIVLIAKKNILEATFSEIKKDLETIGNFITKQ